jgi:hypothetical protein
MAKELSVWTRFFTGLGRGICKTNFGQRFLAAVGQLQRLTIQSAER